MPRTPPLSSVAIAVAVLLGLAQTARGQAPSAPKIAGFEVSGSIDPPGQVEAYISHLAPVGSYYLEVGEADREGTPISTIGRLRRGLDTIGYDSAVVVLPGLSDEVRLQVKLRAHDRVRHIFISGNWPVRQDEIVRRIGLRPGQPLPPEGPDRDARLTLERTRVEDFLKSQGYLDARVTLGVGATGLFAAVNLLVNIRYGGPDTCGFLCAGFPIASAITIRGNQAISSKEIEDKVRHFSWLSLWRLPTPFRQAQLRDDLAALTQRYRDLGYPGARLTHTATPDFQSREVRLHIEVNERKHIETVFEGNRRASASTLKDKLTIFQRGAYDDYEIETSAEAIAQYYRERGHMMVRVMWRRQRVGPQSDRITFNIDEGPSLRVRGVEFLGNQHIPAQRLGDVVNVKVFPRVGAIGLGAGGYASLRQLAVDVDNLKVHYRNEGYPDVKVSCEIAPVPGAWYQLETMGPATEAEWRTAQALYVRFVIHEGPQVRLAQIRFQAIDDPGPLPRDDTFLRELLLSAVGRPFRPGLVREDGERLKRYFGDQGYPQATVEPAPTRSGDFETLVWQVKLGPRIRVGSVFLRGNFFTRDSAILAWVPLRSGSVLTTTDFERGQRNLALMQLFNNASPISFPGESLKDPVVPMLIEVEERHDHWGVIRVGGGLSTEQVPPGSKALFGWYGALGYEHRNLLRRGWTFLSIGNFGNNLIRASASLVDPRLLGTRFRLELSSSYRQQSTVRLGDITEGTGSIGIGRELYPGLDAALRYNIRDTYRTKFFLRSAGPDEDQQTVQVDTVVGSVSLTFDWLRLDNPLVPTRGFKLTGGVEVALPGLSFRYGHDAFVKTIARSLTVVPLLPWLSLRHSVRFDQGLPIGASVLPEVERFSAGGDTTIRGFELDRARTEVTRPPLAPGINSVQYRPVGGSVRVLHNVDLQFPILRPWYGAVFLDSGVVADSLLGLGLERFRHGVGVSPLLIKLPIGDISLSWAWPLDPQAGDARIGRLHLNVGLMF